MKGITKILGKGMKFPRGEKPCWLALEGTKSGDRRLMEKKKEMAGARAANVKWEEQRELVTGDGEERTRETVQWGRLGRRGSAQNLST